MNADRSASRLGELTDLLVDTKEFEEKSHGWEKDRNFEASGGQVFYAIDRDIFDFFLDPFERGPDRNDSDGRRRRTGYSQILRTDDPAVAGVIGDALSDAIFFDGATYPLGPKKERNLLTLDGVQREVFELLEAALRRVNVVINAAAGEVKADAAKQLLQQLRNASPDRKYEIVKEKLPNIFQLFFSDNSAKNFMNRLAALGSKASVTHVGSTNKNDIDKFPLRFLDIVIGSITDREFIDRRIKLRDAVQIEFPSVDSKQEAALSNDLDALSQLLALNERLVPHGFKICLLTGAWSMFAALDGLQVNSNGTVMLPSDSPQEEGLKSSLASKYCLRRPLAFWGSRTFRNNIRKQRTDEEEDEFLDQWTSWVDPIIPRSVAQADTVAEATLREHARRAIQVGLDDGIIEKFKSDWEGFCSLLVPSRAEVSSRFDEEFKEVFGDLQKAFDSSVDSLFDSLASIGLLVSSTTHQQFPSRLSPQIIFDCSEDAQKAIVAVESALYPPAKQEMKGGFTKAMNELRKSDPTGYFFDIGVSMIFANERQYESARIYATRAVNTAIAMARNEAEEKQISGREGYFLLSSLIRLKAKTISDFDTASNLMRLAKSRLAQDRARAEVGISSIRFECEDVARETGKLLFQKYRLNQPAQGREALQLFSQIRKLLNAKYEWREEDLRDKLELRLSINALTLALHCVGGNRNSLTEEDLGEEAAFHLSKALEKSRTVRGAPEDGTFLHQATILASKCMFEGGRESGVTPEAVQALFSDKNISSHKVTNYDERRFIDLRERCLARLK